MCMLSFLPGGVMPDVDALTNGATFNDDGHGFAIVAGRDLIVRKSMDAEYLIAEFVRMRRQYPDGPALFHSRWGTGGSVNRTNCHPFRFGGDRRTVVGHNGVLGKAVQPGKGDKRCDTRIAAEEVIPYAFGHLSDPEARKSLAKWIGPGNKLVILTVNPAYPANAYIINEEKGHWNDDGTWYSNWDFVGRPSRWTSTAPGWMWADDDKDSAYLGMVCAFCRDAGELDEDGICDLCGTCSDCELDFLECECAWVRRSDRLEEEARRDAELTDREEYAALWANELDKRDAPKQLTAGTADDDEYRPVVMGPNKYSMRQDLLNIALASMDATPGTDGKVSK